MGSENVMLTREDLRRVLEAGRSHPAVATNLPWNAALDALARLSSCPPAATEEEGWREKCEVSASEKGTYVRYPIGSEVWYLDKDTRAFVKIGSKRGTDWVWWCCESSARLALAQASRPGEKQPENMPEAVTQADAYTSDPQRRADFIAGFYAGIRESARKAVQPIIDRERLNDGMMPGDSNSKQPATAAGFDADDRAVAVGHSLYRAGFQIIREHSTKASRRDNQDDAKNIIAAALQAAHDAGAATREGARRRWITIRRVGGENDPMARVFVDYEVDGATITLGSELLASNFSTGWNLTALEAKENRQ